MDRKERIRKFILSEICPDNQLESLKDDDPLVEREIIDSIGMLSLLAFLEEHFGIMLATEELSPQNFATLQSITNLVARKLQKE